MRTPVRHVYRAATTAAICLAGLLLPNADALAQATRAGQFRPERPNRALFGGGYGSTEQSLIFTGNIGGGIGFGGLEGQDDVEVPAPDAPPIRTSVGFASADGNLTYSISRERFGFDAGVTSYTRYYPDADVTSTANGIGLGMTANITPRTSVDTRFGMTREPVSLLSLLPRFEDAGGAALSPLDYGFVGDLVDLVRQDVSVSLTRSMTRRSSFSLSYSGNRTQFGDEGVDRWRSGILGSFSYAIARGLSLRAGYGTERYVTEATETEPERRIRGHWIDAGVDFSRELSISRRTTLGFSTGSKMLSDGGRRRFELIGSAVLRREIGRTWSTSLEYSRDVGLVDLVNLPAFTEAVSGNVSGLLGRRVSVSGDVGVSRGDMGVNADLNNYYAYRAGAGMSFGLTRFVGVGVQYSFFRYRFDEFAVPDAFPNSALSRQTIGVSLDVFAPIFTRARRP